MPYTADGGKITWADVKTKDEPNVTIYRRNGWLVGTIARTKFGRCYEVLTNGFEDARSTKKAAHVLMLDKLLA